MSLSTRARIYAESVARKRQLKISAARRRHLGAVLSQVFDTSLPLSLSLSSSSFGSLPTNMIKTRHVTSSSNTTTHEYFECNVAVPLSTRCTLVFPRATSPLKQEAQSAAAASALRLFPSAREWNVAKKAVDSSVFKSFQLALDYSNIEVEITLDENAKYDQKTNSKGDSYIAIASCCAHNLPTDLMKDAGHGADETRKSRPEYVALAACAASDARTALKLCFAESIDRFEELIPHYWMERKREAERMFCNEVTELSSLDKLALRSFVADATGADAQHRYRRVTYVDPSFCQMKFEKPRETTDRSNTSIANIKVDAMCPLLTDGRRSWSCLLPDFSDAVRFRLHRFSSNNKLSFQPAGASQWPSAIAESLALDSVVLQLTPSAQNLPEPTPQKPMRIASKEKLQNSLCIPDYTMMVEEMREHLGLPPGSAPVVNFYQEALHKPKRCLGQLQRGSNGDVDVRTRVVMKWPGTKHEATAVNDPDNHLENCIVDERGNLLPEIERARLEAMYRSSNDRKKRLLHRQMDDAWHTYGFGAFSWLSSDDIGVRRGPLQLIIAALCHLYVQVFDENNQRDSRINNPSNLPQSESVTSQISNGDSARKHFTSRRIPTLLLRPQFRSDDPWMDAIDFIMFSWFEASPQINRFNIIVPLKKVSPVPGAEKDDGSATIARAMLFYDILGQRVLFAETHAFTHDEAVNRLCVLATEINIPRDDFYFATNTANSANTPSMARTAATPLALFRVRNTQNEFEFFFEQALKPALKPFVSPGTFEAASQNLGDISVASSARQTAWSALRNALRSPMLTSQLSALLTVCDAVAELVCLKVELRFVPETGALDTAAQDAHLVAGYSVERVNGVAEIIIKRDSSHSSNVNADGEDTLYDDLISAHRLIVRAPSEHSSGQDRIVHSSRLDVNILSAFVKLAERALESLASALPSDAPLRSAAVRRTILFDCANRDCVLVRDGYPPFSPKFYTAPNLLSQLLQGLTSHYNCTYSVIPTTSTVGRDDNERESDPKAATNQRTMHVRCLLWIPSLGSHPPSRSTPDLPGFPLGVGYGHDKRTAWRAAAWGVLHACFPHVVSQLAALKELEERLMTPSSWMCANSPLSRMDPRAGVRWAWTSHRGGAPPSQSLIQCVASGCVRATESGGGGSDNRNSATAQQWSELVSHTAPTPSAAFIGAAGALLKQVKVTSSSSSLETRESFPVKSVAHSLCAAVRALELLLAKTAPTKASAAGGGRVRVRLDDNAYGTPRKGGADHTTSSLSSADPSLILRVLLSTTTAPLPSHDFTQPLPARMLHEEAILQEAAPTAETVRHGSLALLIIHTLVQLVSSRLKAAVARCTTDDKTHHNTRSEQVSRENHTEKGHHGHDGDSNLGESEIDSVVTTANTRAAATAAAAAAATTKGPIIEEIRAVMSELRVALDVLLYRHARDVRRSERLDDRERIENLLALLLGGAPSVVVSRGPRLLPSSPSGAFSATTTATGTLPPHTAAGGRIGDRHPQDHHRHHPHHHLPQPPPYGSPTPRYDSQSTVWVARAYVHVPRQTPAAVQGGAEVEMDDRRHTAPYPRLIAAGEGNTRQEALRDLNRVVRRMIAEVREALGASALFT